MNIITILVNLLSAAIPVVGGVWWVRSKILAETRKIQVETDLLREDLRVKQVERHKQFETVKQALNNNHSTNIRDDIDEINGQLSTALKGLNKLDKSVERLNTESLSYRDRIGAMEVTADKTLTMVQSMQQLMDNLDNYTRNQVEELQRTIVSDKEVVNDRIDHLYKTQQWQLGKTGV